MHRLVGDMPERSGSAATSLWNGQDARMTEPVWVNSIDSLATLEKIPAAQALRRLLTHGREKWSGRIIPRASTHDVVFTLPSHHDPRAAHVHVTWIDGEFIFSLVAEQGQLVTADRTREPGAPQALDAFLVQLIAYT
jgi:hypothetical protein